MLNIINHQGNANQNHKVIPPHHTHEGGSYQKHRKKKTQKITNVIEDVERLEHLCTVGGESEKSAAAVQRVQEFLEKLKIERPYDPAVLLPGRSPKELKSGSLRDPCPLLFIAAFSTIAERWKPPKCLAKDG